MLLGLALEITLENGMRWLLLPSRALTYGQSDCVLFETSNSHLH